MEPTGFDHHGPDHSGPSSRVALPSARMSTEEVLKASGRYAEESRESDHKTVTKLGVNRTTLTAPASNGLMSGHAFLEYRAELMSTRPIEEQGDPIHCLIKIEISAGHGRSPELLKQEARDLVLFSVRTKVLNENCSLEKPRRMQNENTRERLDRKLSAR